MAWFLPLDYTGKISCQDSTEHMPVCRIQAFWSKQCPFWVYFGYVVPEIKYAPKLVEIISNNGYGMVMAYILWNQAERWRRKIDRQHTPTARLCSPRVIRSRKERRLVSWTQTMHKNYFLDFFAYLGFQVANIVAFIYWSSELVTKNQCRPFFLELGGFSDF